MSRGPGRIQQTIEAAFAANPDDIFATEELIALAYPDAASVEKKHRVSVARAAKAACERTGWYWEYWSSAGSPMVFFNRRSVASYTLAFEITMLSRDRPMAWHREWATSHIPEMSEKLRAIIREQVAEWIKELDG